MNPLKLVFFLLICALVTFFEAHADDNDKQPAIIGHRVPGFVLPDAAGEQVALSDFNDAKTLVVVFIGTQCPIGNAYVPVLGDLQERYQDQSVQVIGINSNLSDSAESVAKHVSEFKVSFPVLVDEDQIVADLFGARRKRLYSIAAATSATGDASTIALVTPTNARNHGRKISRMP